MKKKLDIRLRAHGGHGRAAYLELKDHPHEVTFGLVKRAIDVHELITEYNGPRITLEFDEHDRPVGIEIIYPDEERNDNCS